MAQVMTSSARIQAQNNSSFRQYEQIIYETRVAWSSIENGRAQENHPKIALGRCPLEKLIGFQFCERVCRRRISGGIWQCVVPKFSIFRLAEYMRARHMDKERPSANPRHKSGSRSFVAALMIGIG